MLSNANVRWTLIAILSFGGDYDDIMESRKIYIDVFTNVTKHIDLIAKFLKPGPIYYDKLVISNAFLLRLHHYVF